MSTSSQSLRFSAAQRAFEELKGHPLANAPLRTWTKDSDSRQLPVAFLSLTLRRVLQTPFRKFEMTAGIGPAKLDQLLVLVERALTQLRRAATRSDVPKRPKVTSENSIGTRIGNCVDQCGKLRLETRNHNASVKQLFENGDTLRSAADNKLAIRVGAELERELDENKKLPIEESLQFRSDGFRVRPRGAESESPPINGTARSTHSQVRETLAKLFLDNVFDSESVSDALALAAHPWPDAAVPQRVMEAIAAELLPARNLCHHDIREVAIDRLLRIAETLEHETECAIAVKFIEASNQLQISTESAAPALFRHPMPATGGLINLLLSPFGIGVPIANCQSNVETGGPHSPALTAALAHLYGLGARSGSMDLGLICGDEPTGVTVQELARRLDVSLPLDEFDRYIGQLNSRDHDILVTRSFALETPDTLEDVAKRWKVSRERIRQLEGTLKASVGDRFASTFRRLGQPVLYIHTQHVVQIDLLKRSAQNVVSASRWHDTAAAVLLQIIGPWRCSDGWAVHSSIDARVSELKNHLESTANKFGILSNEVVDETFRDLFESESDQDGYATGVLGLRRICDRWIIRDSNKCRVAAALQYLGRPSTKHEVAELTGLSGQEVVSIFGSIDDVVRADKHRWGFGEWIDDPYEGIFGEIMQRIEDGGGSIPVNLIIADLPGRFGVSEASVRAYLGSDAFAIEGQFVRKADSNEYSPRSPDLCSGAVRVGEVWGQRLQLLDRHFAGYSLGVTFDIAFANGVCPDDNLLVPIVGSDYEVSVIWRRHSLNRMVDIGRISDFLKSAGYEEGSEIVVFPKRDSVEVLSITEVESRISHGALNTAAHLFPLDGVDVSNDVHDPLLDLLGG